MRVILLVIVASALLPISTAWASTAAVSGSTLVYSAAAGENNTISFEPAVALAAARMHCG